MTTPHTDPRIDAYIEAAAPFAQPILRRLRELVHAVCPEVTETLKWGFPHFMHHGILCSMAAFKAHSAFGFWKGRQIVSAGKPFESMGQFGRLRSLDDLPPATTLRSMIEQAVRQNESGAKSPRKVDVGARPPLPMPDDLAAALRAAPAAQGTFDGFSPSHRREYIEWIVEAKRPETRRKRLQQAIEWLVEGKRRNWKYERC